MLSRRALLHSAAIAPVAMACLSNGSIAQEVWPAREVHAVCGFPPGSGADIYVRFYAKKLQDALGGKTVIVENKVGAFGNISTEYLAKSKPDGHTIGIMPGSSFLAAAPSLFKNLAFDPINDFEHVALLAKLPFLLVVSGDSPFKTLPELTAFLKEKGDKASYGSIANTSIVSSELYKAQFGLKTVEVKYKDAGVLNDLYGGNIAFMHIDPASAAALVKSGKLRALATSAAEPIQALKDIPSAKQAGILNSNIIAWWSVQAPKGTPKPVLEKLEKLFSEIALADDTREFLANVGSDPFIGGPDQIKKLLIDDTKAWADYVKLAHIETN